jgi:hypothetical protein
MKFNLLLFIALHLFIQVFSQENNKEMNKLQCIELCKMWNEYHSNIQIPTFINLYADSVLYYGTKKSVDNCINAKMSYLRKHNDYNQKIVSEVLTEFDSEKNEYYCEFIKKTTQEGKSNYFASYLVFKFINKDWRIIIESDYTTDSKLTKANRSGLFCRGDFNGDGKKEYVYVVRPEILHNELECKGDCNCKITFTDETIPIITISNCIGGTPVNKGDLNENKTDEIGFLPSWFTSCWHDYLVYTFLKGKWEFAVKPFPTHCSQWEDGVNPIEKDPNKNGNVIIRYMKMGDIDFKVKTMSMKIKK